MERMKRGKTPPTLHATETSKAYGPEEEEFDPDADAAPGLALQEAQTKLAEMQARRERGRTPPTMHAQERTEAEPVEPAFAQPTMVPKTKPSFERAEPAFAQPTMVPKMKPSFQPVPTAPPPAQPTQAVPLEVPGARGA